MRRRLAALAHDRRGGVAVMAAVGGALACLMAGVVVDLGSVALQARRVQGAADLAALAAAADLDHAQAAAAATVQDNLGPGVVTVAATGLYRADPGTAPAARFAADALGPNAARVTVTAPATLYFGRYLLGRDDWPVTRTGTAATAASDPLAMIAIGSRLASLNAGLANQLLSGLTGSTVSLNLMDYRALADADVTLLDFTDALATDLDVRAGDYDALLEHQVDAGRALDLLELLAGGQAGSALDRLAVAADGLTFKLGELIGLEAATPQALKGGLSARVSSLELAHAIIEVGAGPRQVRLDTGAQTGLASLDIWLAIGERPNRSPWLTVTDAGDPVIRTAQARLYLEAWTSQKLSGIGQVTLPILVELAASEARLNSIDCAAGPSAQVGVRPGVARLTVGSVDRARLDDFTATLGAAPATLLSVAGVASVAGKADLEAADQSFSPVTWSADDIAAGRIKTVRSTGFASAAVTSLLSRLQVTVKTFGVGLGLGDLGGAMATLLAPIGPVLDSVVAALTDLAGLGLGEADVAVLGVTCPDARAAAPVLVG